MALPVNPVMTSEAGGAVSALGGSNRFIWREIRHELGYTGSLVSMTYGGQAAFRIESFPLPGNQLFIHIAFFNEAAIAARGNNNFVPTWSSGSPGGATFFTGQYNDIDQGLPINELVSDSNSGGGIILPPSLSALIGGAVVLSCGSGAGGSTFPWVNYTQQSSQGGGGYTWATATQAIAVSASVPTEYAPIPGANRSALVAFSLNEAGSVGVGISSINAGIAIYPGLASVVIVGILFGLLQGSGFVTLSPTDDVGDPRAVTIAAGLTWTDTSITFTVPPFLSLLYGEIYAFVTNNDDEVNPNGFPVQISVPTDRAVQTIFTVHPWGILAGALGIEEEADQIEYLLLSENGGTVHIDISGLFSIRDYPGAIPATDIIYVRLGDSSDQTWSSQEPQAIGINQTGGDASAGGFITGQPFKLIKPIIQKIVR